MHTFHQHTDVHWLRIGPAIVCILEQWDVICEFMKELAKDGKKAPKSNSYNSVSAMLIEVEKDVTKSTLESFLNIVIPMF